MERRLSVSPVECHKTISAPTIIKNTTTTTTPSSPQPTIVSSTPEVVEPLPSSESRMLRWLQNVGPCGTSCLACSVLHKLTTKYCTQLNGRNMLDPSPIVEAGEEGWAEVDDNKGVSLLSLTNVAVRNTEDRTVWMQSAHLASGYMELVIIPAVDRLT